jgi:hypothetical protein
LYLLLGREAGMATLKGYFDTDFFTDLSMHKPIKFQFLKTDLELEVIGRIHLNFDANVIYVSYYVPSTSNLFRVCTWLIDNLAVTLAIKDGVEIQSSFEFEVRKVVSSELNFSGRVFIYSEANLTNKELTKLIEYCKQKGYSLIFRSSTFADQRAAVEKPLAFISHDSRDKDEIARPLATKLISLRCPVWYDEFSLKAGDSLRENIEKGIKDCKKCVLVISPHFLSNKGWTKVEFDSIFTRQIIERQNIVIPVWHNVKPQEVYEYSPSLADKKAIIWSPDLDAVSRELYRAITT